MQQTTQQPSQPHTCKQLEQAGKASASVSVCVCVEGAFVLSAQRDLSKTQACRQVKNAGLACFTNRGMKQACIHCLQCSAIKHAFITYELKQKCIHYLPIRERGGRETYQWSTKRSGSMVPLAKMGWFASALKGTILKSILRKGQSKYKTQRGRGTTKIRTQRKTTRAATRAR